MNLKMLRRAAAGFALFLIGVSGAQASGLDAPSGDVVLAVNGAIEHTNGDGVARFDMAMLEALGATEFDTTTIWTEGKHNFMGVSLDVVLATVGASGDTLKATAVNDYAVEIPASDAKDGGPIIAYRMDGKAMSVRDKGPLWIVYPYDSNRNYRSEVIYSRSIWQLVSIDVIE